MADDLSAPVQTDISAAPNPFDQFDPDKLQLPAAAAPQAKTANPFDAFDPDLAPEAQTSGMGAFMRGAERSAIPAAGGLAAMGAGAELGAAVGAGVGGPIGAGVGGVAGGLAGAIGGSMAVQAVQDFALQALPPNWVDFMGMDQKQQELDQTYHPTETFLGGLVPYALTMKPGMGAVALPANATAYQRIVANPMTARFFSGAINGGMELGQEVVQGQQPNWTNIGIATGFGVIFNRNNRIGERITEAGAAPVRRVAGIAGPTIEAAKTQEVPDGAGPRIAPDAAQETGATVTAKDWNETILGQKPVTVAQAGDTSVMGPGMTEDVFMGSHDASPQAAMAAQEAARTEKSATTAPDAPDVHAVARRIEPELFSHYDDLAKQRDELRAHLAQIASPNDEAITAAQESVQSLQAQLDQHLADRGGYAGGPQARTLKSQIRDAQNQVDALAARRDAFASGEGADTPEMTAIRKQIMDTDFAMRDLAPQISAANRRAADWSQSEVVEPDIAAPVISETAPYVAPEPAGDAIEQPGPGAAPTLSVQEQAAAIAEDVAQQLMAAGRSEAEAKAAGQLIGAHYKARAGRFGGALGTPLDLYRKEGATIRGINTVPTRVQSAVPAPVAARPTLDPIIAKTIAAKAGVSKLVEQLIGRGASDGEIADVIGKKMNPEQISAFRTSVTENKPPLMPTIADPVIGRHEQVPPRAAAAQSEPMTVDQSVTPAGASEIEALNPNDIGVDAKRFQFKEGGDESGVTDRLQGVEKWDPRLAGTALVFRDADGKNWIADGHQRLGLAKRLSEGQPDIKINSFVLNEADGITDGMARAIAAAKNIAEGTGTAVDAAKILRAAKDDGVDLPPLPPRSTLVRDGRALAELSPDAFGMVVNEVIPAGQGAMVGRLVKNPAEQVEAIRLIAQAKPENAQQAELIVRDMLGSGTEMMTRQDSLFGEEAFASSIVLERAKIADEAIKQLRKDKATFSTLVKESDRIQGAGENVLDQAANTSRLTTDEKASDLLTQLAFRAGPVSDALSAVSRRLKAGEIRASEAAREFLGIVRSAVESGVDTGADVGGAVAGPAGERQGLATEPGVEGLPQTLMPGIEPITDRQRMEAEANRGLEGGDTAANGMFDEDALNQQTLFQQKRGQITFAPGKKPLIKMFADANASTFLHESGHQWLEELIRDAAHEAAPQSIRDDLGTVKKWLGMEGDTVATKHHEKFARGFEQYVREGVAPSPGLARVFAQFKSWLTSIYASIKGLGTPISDDVRAVFDRMLDEEPQRTVIAPDREAAAGIIDLHETESVETHPREAEPAMDRVVAERDRYIAEQSPEVQNELAIAEAEQRAADAAANARPETAASPDGSAEVGALGGEPETLPAGGASGSEPGAQFGGGGAAGTEGAGLPAGSGTGTGDAAGLRPQRSEPANAARAQPLAPSPNTLFGPDESPFTDKAGNIRIENLTTNEDVAQAIRDSAAENNDFIGDRRGVITDGQVLDLADALGMDAAQLDQRKLGQAFNAEQIMAARKLLIESATDMSAIMKRAAASGSDADVMAYAQAKDRHNLIQAQVAGITAEAGRALRAFRSIAGQETAIGVDQFLRNATGKTLFQLKEEIKLGALIDTPSKVSKFARDAQKRDFASMAVEYWINGLVSGPKTQVTNVVGNTIMGLQVMGPETAAAAAIGAMRKALGREGSTVRLGEVAAHMRAAAKSLPSALLATGDAIRTGRSIALPGEDVKPLPYQPGSEFAHSAGLNENATYPDIVPALFGGVRGILDGIVAIGTLVKSGGDKSAPAVSWKHSPLGSIPDVAVRGTTVLPLGSAIRLPTRFLAAGDSFFRAMLYSMEKNGQAYRMAADEGLTGTARDARIADLRQNPTPDLMEASRSIASDTVFMGRSSEFISALSKLANTNIMGLPLLKFVTPFINTPASIIEQAALRRTPMGVFSPEIRADLMGKNGNVAQDTAMARMLVGTTYAIAFGTLAARGLITGSGPTDPNAAAAWRQAGNQPHSMRIGDTWYDMRALGPLGMLAGMSADTYDVSHAAETGDLAGAAASLQHAFMQNILDASWMTGPSDLIQALEDPGRYGSSYVSKFLSSFVPFSGAMGQVARANDPFSRQARGIIDSIRAKVYGLSEGLQPRIDIWGEPMPQQSTLGPSLVSSVYTTNAAKDPVNLAFQQANYWPGAVDRKIRGVPLTDEQYTEFATIAGRMLKQRLNVVVGSPTWNNWDAPTRHDVISEIVRQSRETARGYMFSRHPALVQQAVAAKLAPLGGK